MTDTSSLAITHATTDSYPVSAPLSASVDGANSDSGAPDEGTIKCICKFDDDDGRTVLCGTCDTWQHLACFYKDEADEPDEDEAHYCNDCQPRLDGDLDMKRAHDIQRRRKMREKSEEGYRRKRPSVKATKKKSKSGDSNGFGHQRSESGARDQPPSKKSKTSHRASTSISALPGAPSLPQEPRKRRSSASASSSPTKVLGPSIPLYSNEFLHLYDEDEKHNDMNSNLFVTVNLVSESASWVKNPDALAQVTNGRRAEEIFNWSDAALDRSRWPSLTTETITDSTIDINGRHPTWKTVKTQEAVQKDQIVGEITGKVGVFDDYCPDPNNRWSELHHPEPFVFFSPQLPLYIDGRREGSMLRYTRRSCRPNVTMKIFITNDVEYHFCFVAKEDIAPGSEITVMWYLDSQLFGASNGLVKQESGDSMTDAVAVAACLSNTLANFGGCACGQESCLLARFDHRQHPRALESSIKSSAGKRKKAKTKAAPDSGRASISRAGSESTKPFEEDDVAGDARSTSGSARGQTISRDLSPTNPNPGLDLLSSRERRKIADAEKQFQQLEHDQKTTKKKKRTSGPSVQSPVAAQQGGGFGPQRGGKSLRIDTATGEPNSPNSALSPGSLPMNTHNSVNRWVPTNAPLPAKRKSKYVDVSIQCDLDEEPTVRRPIHPDYVNWVPFNVRNLRRVQDMYRKKRAEDEAAAVAAAEEASRQKLSTAGSDSVAPVDSSSPVIDSPVHEKVDVVMMDVDTPKTAASVPESSKSESNNANELRLPSGPPPWSSTTFHTMRYFGAPDDRANLRVSMPPPPSVPAIPAAISPVSAASLASPSTADATSPHSAQPAGVPTPPPAKKKLSFADYINRRGTLTTPTSEKTHAQAAAAASSTQALQGPAATSDDAVTPTKPSLDSKPESLESRDVVMKDASDPAQPNVPSISS